MNAHWAGLGFYRRARLLHKGAKRVVEHYGGEVPTTVTELQKIDGIGPYTASAVASIAFDVCVPVVDGNVCRVLSRLRGIANHIKAPILKDDVGWKLAEQIVTSGDGKHAGEVNQAMMELGATFCAPSGSGIDDRDPLKTFYMSTQLGMALAKERQNKNGTSYRDSTKYVLDEGEPLNGLSGCRVCDPGGVASVLNDLYIAFDNIDDLTDCAQAATAGHAVFPLSPPKKEKREEVLAVAAISCISPSTKKERWLLCKRPKNGLLAGQWEFPSVHVWTSDTKCGNKKGAAVNRTPSNQKVPNIDPRQRLDELNGLLDELVVDTDDSPVHPWLRNCSRENIASSPLEHIFSHVRHTMWIEYGTSPRLESCDNADAWITATGKEVRLMTEADMKKVGVTSAIKKILKSVKAHRA